MPTMVSTYSISSYTGCSYLVLVAFLDREIWYSEHFGGAQHEFWPKEWLILGKDAFGNYYVADLNSSDANGEYPIMHVDHETLTATSMQPYASTYFGLLERLADQQIAEYTPDGILKSLRDGNAAAP